MISSEIEPATFRLVPVLVISYQLLLFLLLLLVFSLPLEVVCSVPQGSVLEPLISNIFTTDLQHSIKHCTVLIFTDVTKMCEILTHHMIGSYFYVSDIRSMGLDTSC
jgi:hypothetical protein